MVRVDNRWQLFLKKTPSMWRQATAQHIIDYIQKENPSIDDLLVHLKAIVDGEKAWQTKLDESYKENFGG